MRALVVVDTSVWITALRRGPVPTWRPNLDRLISNGTARIPSPCLAELSIGARSSTEQTVIEALAGSGLAVETTCKDWLSAADFGRSWRTRGRTLGIVDCLVADMARRLGAALWTLDRDFEPVFELGQVLRFDAAGS